MLKKFHTSYSKGLVIFPFSKCYNFKILFFKKLLLLVHRNAINFWIVTLNSAYLINLFVNSKAFINISDFFTYTVKLANVQTITEHRRIDAFELWYWRRLLRVPWTTRRSNQSILKEISLEYSLEGLMLKLKLQYFGHLMRRTDQPR